MVDGKSVGKAEEYELKNVVANHTIIATFEPFSPGPNLPHADFMIDASATAGGAISPSGAVGVNAGQDVTFHFTPNQGYRLSNVTVDGQTVKTDGKTYTFRDIQGNHTIKATFEKSGVAPKTSDNTNIALYIALLIGASGAVVITSLRVKRQSR